MTKPDRAQLSLYDEDEDRRLWVAWSRSGKTMIVTVGDKRFDSIHQISLRPNQVESLIEFLTATIATRGAT